MAKLPHQIAQSPLAGQDVVTKSYADASGGGGGYERAASFGIPFGSSTREATLGRIIFDGSLIGVSLELNEPVTAGSITVNIKINDTISLQAILNTTYSSQRVITAPEGTWSVLSGSRITVEVIASGYQNAAFGQPAGGLVVNAAFVVGAVST